VKIGNQKEWPNENWRGSKEVKIKRKQKTDKLKGKKYLNINWTAKKNQRNPIKRINLFIYLMITTVQHII
jgi:hypothetical protein